MHRQAGCSQPHIPLWECELPTNDVARWRCAIPFSSPSLRRHSAPSSRGATGSPMRARMRTHQPAAHGTAASLCAAHHVHMYRYTLHFEGAVPRDAPARVPGSGQVTSPSGGPCRGDGACHHARTAAWTCVCGGRVSWHDRVTGLDEDRCALKVCEGCA